MPRETEIVANAEGILWLVPILKYLGKDLDTYLTQLLSPHS